MKVFVVVQHYDRGSDEVNVEAVFKTEIEARSFIMKKFPGWEEVEDEREGWYQDPQDASFSDRVFIQEAQFT